MFGSVGKLYLIHGIVRAEEWLGFSHDLKVLIE